MSEVKMSAIDRALAAAKARKAQRATADVEETPPAPVKAKAPKAPKAKEPKAVDPEKAARLEARAVKKAEKIARDAAAAEAKAQRKAQREAKRAAKAAEKAAAAANKRPAHMKKVENARAKLPALVGEELNRSYEEIVSNYSSGMIEALSQHLALAARAKKTVAAGSMERLPLGATVQILGGDHRLIGLTGKVVHSQKLRAKIEVPGMKKVVYIYNGEAKVVS